MNFEIKQSDKYPTSSLVKCCHVCVNRTISQYRQKKVEPEFYQGSLSPTARRLRNKFYPTENYQGTIARQYYDNTRKSKIVEVLAWKATVEKRRLCRVESL